jgi:serine/threonine-protein kinase
VRAGVVVPVILGVLLVVAVAVAAIEFTRADDERSAQAAPTSIATTTTSSASPLSPPPPPPPAPPPSSAPSTATDTSDPATTAAPAAAAAVIGADCSPEGSTSTTADGTDVYCSTLQGTQATIWSLTPGDVPSPTVTVDPTEQPLPVGLESPIRVCMQQTGQTRRECREDIRRSNEMP